MKNSTFYVEIPIMGQQEIRLYNESKQIYELFKDELLRLKDIMQLGPLHYFSEKLFRYTRYDHILTMLLLISRLEELSKIDKLKATTIKRRLSTEVKLNGVRFSSISELLKSWTLLYAIGHFQMTFAAEHAFLRWIKSQENYEHEFLEILQGQIVSSRLFEGDPLSDSLYNKLKRIVEQEHIMQVYKIFTFLKILKKAEELEDSELINSLRELAKLMIFRENYPDYYDNPRRKTKEHREKIKDIIEYFLILRSLAFTILDGYVAQSPIQLTYYAALDSLPLFIENKNYKAILSNIESFYTKALYQSTEGAYYHLRATEIIERNFFSQYNSVAEFINDAISNKIDRDILTMVELESKHIATERHRGSINEVISMSIELILDSLSRPISREIEYFNTVSGTILYNMAERKYQVFVYPSLIRETDMLKRIYELLRLSKISYQPLYDYEREAMKDSFASMRRKTRLLNIAMRESSKIANHILGEIFDSRIVTKLEELPFPEISGPTLIKWLREHKIFPFGLYVPSLISFEYLQLYLKQPALFETCKNGYSKGESSEKCHLFDILTHMITTGFKWYLISLNTKLKEKDNTKAELDIVVAGFSPECFRVSISEVKSGKQKHSREQLKRHTNILESVKIKFESYGYNVSLRNSGSGRDVKTQILEVSVGR